MHPINNTSPFKAFIFKSNLSKIFFGFLVTYLFLSFFFYIIYIMSGIEQSDKLIEYSLYTSFGFNFDAGIKNNNYFIYISYVHQIIALLVSTIFTAAIVLKFFYLPNFFVFKQKCNYLEEDGKLIISLYNSIDMFVTNCKIQIYARVEWLDTEDKSALLNLNDNKPIFEKIYPFMEPYLVTRLVVPIHKCKDLGELLLKRENKTLEFIILVEANASNLGNIHETYKYTIKLSNFNETVDLYPPKSIDLNNKDYKKSKGWENFEK